MPEQPRAAGAVFLSYASQDAGAAKKICDALRAAGVEVWFDQNELVGGDAWDAKIRKQIKECALFVPIISAATQARREGYFRLEWRLAVERMQHMDDDLPFLLPVVIDDTTDAGAFVPDKFRAVQWTRLSVKDPPETLAARVGKLLAGTTGQRSASGPGGQTSQAGGGTRRRDKTNSWVRVVVPIAGMLFGLIFMFRSAWSPAKHAEAKPGAVAATPSMSEAQKLVTQARKIYEEGDELDRETLFLADDLVKRALALDGAEPSAWLLGAQLSYAMVWQAFDGSEARKADLQRQAARARALAPESVPAQLAVVNAQLATAFTNFQSTSYRQDLATVERDLLALAERAPRDYQVQRALGQTYRFFKRPDEALRALQRSLELSGGDPGVSADVINVLLRRKRYAEAEAMVAPALARRPIGRMLVLDVMFKTQWRGDLAGAQAALAAWPGWLLREDRGAFIAWQTWMWSRQPDRALEVAARLSRDYLHDNWFTGPRAVLTARAHELAGHEEAAQVDWRTVVRLAERELAVSPEDVAALFWKAWAQSRLGDQAAAQATSRLLQQRNLTTAPLFRTTSLALLWSTMGRTDLAAAHLSAGIDADNDAYAVTRVMLELDPAYAPLRADPQFAELAAAALAPAPPPAAPPSPSSLSLSPSTLSAADSKSVAVLAFANLSDDKANEYFSDGISEELLNVLAKIPGLKVSARTSAFYFKGKEVPVPEIAKQLGVAYVVEGSVRKAGDKVRITAQLIKAADGFHVWSDIFTRDLKDIFAVQDEIAGLIAKNLQLKMGIGSPESRREVNPEAHRLVLEGRHFLAARTSVGFEQAERAFIAALKIDPQFALAQAGLASTTALRGRYRLLDGVGRVEEFDQLALAQSRVALQMDPTLAEPHATIGFVYTDTGRLAEAEAEFQLAFAANPNYATAYHWHSHVLAARGRLDLALQEIGRAEALDPVSFIILYIRGFYLTDARQYAEALAVLDRAAAIRGESFLPLESDRARALLALGRKAEALATARKVLRDPRLITSGWYAAGEALNVLHLGGAADEADRLASTILQAMPAGSYQRGYVHCAIGNFTEGLRELAHIPDIVQSRLYWHPMLEPVHETPQFRQLLEKFNSVEEFKIGRATLARMLKEQGAK